MIFFKFLGILPVMHPNLGLVLALTATTGITQLQYLSSKDFINIIMELTFFFLEYPFIIHPTILFTDNILFTFIKFDILYYYHTSLSELKKIFCCWSLFKSWLNETNKKFC